MLINVKDIRYNRFRDLTLNPINDDHVDVLTDSIDELGFFSGITVRPLEDNTFEAAAGHHRFEAVKKLAKKKPHDKRFKTLEAIVNNYTDDEMVAIMVKENATQRGGSTHAIMDSVAATARIITKQVLLGEGDAVKKLMASNHNALGNAQTAIAKDGPGGLMIYQAINGFAYEDRREAKSGGRVETMSRPDIDNAVGQLKESGYMAKLVGEVYADVEAIRAEKRKADEAERARKDEEEARQRAAAERAQRAAEEAEARAAETKRKAEEAAKLAAENRRKEDAERAEKAAAKAERDRLASIEAEKERKLRQDEADKAAAERAERNRTAAAQAEAERKQKAAIEAQKAEERILDINAVNVFTKTSHQATFKKYIIGQRAQLYIPKSQQLALAQKIRGEIDTLERAPDGSVEMSSAYIADQIMKEIQDAENAQRTVKAEEARQMRLKSRTLDINARWENIRRSMLTVERELMAIDKELKDWDYDRSLFPINVPVIRVVSSIADRFNTMARRMGLKD